MTPKQFQTAMKKLQRKYGDDEERLHVDMDELMCKVLSTCGYHEGVAVFVEQKKWYG